MSLSLQQTAANQQTPSSDWHDALTKGELQRALELSQDPSITDALYILLHMQKALRNKRYNQAATLISDAPELTHLQLEPHSLSQEIAVLGEANQALERRQPEKALTHLAGVQLGPLQAERETLIGTAAIFINDLSEATRAFTQALVLDPKHHRALTNLGNLHLEAGDLETAITYYEQALTLQENYSNALHNLAVAYRRQGHIHKSVSLLRKAQRASGQEAKIAARDARGGSLNLKWTRYVLYGLGIAAVLWALGVLR